MNSVYINTYKTLWEYYFTLNNFKFFVGGIHSRAAPEVRRIVGCRSLIYSFVRNTHVVYIPESASFIHPISLGR
jgi:hypothetical protein